MRINFYRSVTEALGFGVHKYDTAVRLAWFPLLLNILFSLYLLPYIILSLVNGKLVTLSDVPLQKAVEAIAQGQVLLWQQHTVMMIALDVFSYLFLALMYASFLVPLLQYAARGIPPSHRSVVLHIGPRHLKFVAAALLSIVGLVLLFGAPFSVAIHFIQQYVVEAMNQQYAVFPDENSLHTIEIRQGIDNLLPYQLSVILLQIVSTILILYFSLRFFAVPFFAAVREKGDSYKSIGASWRLSRGWNAAKLALVILVLGLLQVLVMLALNLFVMPMTMSALQMMYQLITGTTGVMEDLNTSLKWVQDLLIWLWALIRIVINILLLSLFSGIITGLGGSLFRQAGLGKD